MLFRSVISWLEGTFNMSFDPSRTLISLQHQFDLDMHPEYLFDYLRDQADGNPEMILDVVDFTLSRQSELNFDSSRWMHLEDTLSVGGSLWQVVEAKSLVSLEERVEQQTREIVANAPSVPGDLLREAWQFAYGRHPKPSEACRKSIECVESVLCSIVEPNQKVGTLGKVIAELRQDLARDEPKFGVVAKMRQSDPDKVTEPTPYEAFVGTVSTLWPGPNRHPGMADFEDVAIAEGRQAALTALYVIELEACEAFGAR